MPGERGDHRIRRRAIATLAVASALLLGAAAAWASHLLTDTEGHTMVEQVVTGTDPAAGYSNLHTEPASTGYVVRDATSESDPALPAAHPGRESRRTSLGYFGQMSDFQLADEESPARVEFLDGDPSGTGEAAWRPQEALHPFIIDASIRQLNTWTPASPVAQFDGSRARMGFVLLTGDQLDSTQRNEAIWTRDLLEGRATRDFNSGSSDPADYDPTAHPSCAAYPPTPDHLAEAARYTGVQDYSDYPANPQTYFYDPNDVRGYWAAKDWPSYPGLMDRAEQLAFRPAGLDVPSYVANGNHDGLVQGNQASNAAFEDIGTGCFKATGSVQPPSSDMIDSDGPDPTPLLSPAGGMLVPPDPLRRYVSKPQLKSVYEANSVDNGHGYGFVDPAEDAASNGSAEYYAWDPPQASGFRFIALDTLSEGGVVAQSADGNIDDPQFQWLAGQLAQARARDQLVILFGHHPVRSLVSDVPDEAAGACAGPQHQHGDVPEHYANPGCDADPRSSEPIHLGEDPQAGDPRESLVELIDQYPNVIAYVAGHTHRNQVNPFPRTGGGVWWGIETSAIADWPVQSRLLEVMDNHDGTLSIFGTMVDAAAPATAPPAGDASGFDVDQLASINRVFAYNDPQAHTADRAGAPKDQNVELLVRDPRQSAAGYARPKGATPMYASLVEAYKGCVSPDRRHAPPLEYGSCSVPQQESAYATVGTADSNHQATKSVGWMRARVLTGDVGLSASVNDVREKGSLAGYGGSLLGRAALRITDRRNGPAGDGTDAATGAAEVKFEVPCVGLANPTDGSTCSVDTSMNAIAPGAVVEGARAIWELGQVRVEDGGADGSGVTTGDNTVFLRQGIFVP